VVGRPAGQQIADARRGRLGVGDGQGVHHPDVVVEHDRRGAALRGAVGRVHVALLVVEGLGQLRRGPLGCDQDVQVVDGREPPHEVGELGVDGGAGHQQHGRASSHEAVEADRAALAVAAGQGEVRCPLTA
jgi:hypothetical protein